MMSLVTDNDVVANGFNAVQIVAVLISTIIPMVVALVTKSTAAPGVKAVVNLSLVALTAFLTEWINNGDDFYWQGALLTTVVGFITSVGVYYGLLKPTNLAGSNSTLGKAPGLIG